MTAHDRNASVTRRVRKNLRTGRTRNSNWNSNGAKKTLKWKNCIYIQNTRDFNHYQLLVPLELRMSQQILLIKRKWRKIRNYVFFNHTKKRNCIAFGKLHLVLRKHTTSYCCQKLMCNDQNLLITSMMSLSGWSWMRGSTCENAY